MKALKLLSILVFAVFLVGTVSAFGYIYSEWDNGNQNAIITEGNSVDFNYDFISDSSPMTININLYDSEDNIIIPFITNQPITTPCSGLPEAICYAGEDTIPSNLTAGSYELIMSADNIGKSKTLYLTINPLPDTTAPVITLLGDNPVLVVEGTSYVDAGATALDDIDGDITSSIVVVNPVDVNTIGIYTITYNVKDNAGNFAAPVTRTVQVVEDGTDTTAPIITVITPQPATYSTSNMRFRISTNEPAITEYSLDGTANVQMTETSTNTFDSGLLTLIEGSHTVTFTAVDAAGNTATESVNFFVDLSGKAPIITVIVPKEKEYDKSKLIFEIKVDEIAEAEFSLDGEVRVSMDYRGISNGILTFAYEIELKDGNHEVTFYATDAAGNTASVTVEFSIDTNEESDKTSNKKYTNYYQTNYEEELYLDQFEQKKIIYLDEEDPEKKELNFWQKFIAWLKKIFGFN